MFLPLQPGYSTRIFLERLWSITKSLTCCRSHTNASASLQTLLRNSNTLRQNSASLLSVMSRFDKHNCRGLDWPLLHCPTDVIPRRCIRRCVFPYHTKHIRMSAGKGDAKAKISAVRRLIRSKWKEEWKRCKRLLSGSWRIILVVMTTGCTWRAMAVSRFVCVLPG